MRLNLLWATLSISVVISGNLSPAHSQNLSAHSITNVFDGRELLLGENGEMAVFANTGMGGKVNDGYCHSVATVVAVINKPPDYTLSREILWNKYRPFIEKAVADKLCTDTSVKFGQPPDYHIKAWFFYRGLEFDQQLNPLSESAGQNHSIVAAAFADFPTSWSLKKLYEFCKVRLCPNTRFETFAPMIYGWYGRDNALNNIVAQTQFASTNDERQRKVLALIEDSYEGFPEKPFLQYVFERQVLNDAISKQQEIDRQKAAREAVKSLVRFMAAFGSYIHEAPCSLPPDAHGWAGRPWWCE